MSLSVVASAVVVAVGLRIGDPIIGLIITLVILRITWRSFITVQRDPGSEFEVHETIRRITITTPITGLNPSSRTGRDTATSARPRTSRSGTITAQPQLTRGAWC